MRRKKTEKNYVWRMQEESYSAGILHTRKIKELKKRTKIGDTLVVTICRDPEGDTEKRCRITGICEHFVLVETARGIRTCMLWDDVLRIRERMAG